MKAIKKSFLIFVSILLLLSNINTRIYADDETQQNSDPTYSATFEFVLDEEGELPEEVIALLPETKEGLKQGDVLTNDSLDNVETDEAIYSFKEWNYNEYTIDDSDIHFVGTWTKADKVINPNNTSKTNEDDYITIDYKFYEINASDMIGNLPDEIMNLLPETRKAYKGDSIEPAEINQLLIDGYEWHGWESFIDEKGNVLFEGIWWNTNKSNRLRAPSLRAATNVFGYLGQQAWGVTHAGYNGTNGFSMNGQYAYCINARAPLPSIGALYDDVGGGSSRLAEIAYYGETRGKTQGQTQAAIWNELGGYSTVNGAYEDPSEYSLPGYACSITLYSDGSHQDLISGPSCWPVRTPHGYVNVKKVAANTSFNFAQNCPNNYSLAGAVYGVYTDANCTNEVASLTTDASGNTPNTSDLTPGTYYVKEISASPGFRLDSKLYEIVVPDSDTPVTVTSTEDPISDPFDIMLYKLDKRESKYVTYLDEAEFTLKYWDSNSPSGNPKYTWVFKAEFNSQGKAVVQFDKAHYVSGPNDMWHSTGKLILPLGSFTVQETTAPTLFAIDPNIYYGKVVDKGGYAEAEVEAKGWLEVDNEDLSQSEELQTVSLVVQKLNAETGTTELPTDVTNTATLEGAVFHVYRVGEYNTASTPVMVDIAPVDYGTITTDSTGKAELKYEPNTTNGLLPGKFKIVEEIAPNGFTLNETEFVLEAPIKEAETATFEYSLEIGDKLTRIQIEKLDDNGNQVPYSAGAVIQLIETASGKVVFEFTYEGKPKVIKGLTTLTNYHLHELSVNPNYQLAPDKDVTPIAEDDSSLHTYHMIDHKIEIHTTAYFDNKGKKAWDDQSNKHYVADGIAHIYDDVTYKNLTANDDYVLVGTLYDLTDDAMLTTTVRHPFKPKFAVGQETLKFEQNLDGLDGHTLVVFEELYHVTSTGEVLVSEHKDKTDANQTIYVDKLYKADFEILKVDADTNLPLEGVEFNVKTSRTRRDGTLEEVDLGKFTTDVDGKITINNIKEDSTITVTETKTKDHSYFKWENPFTYQLGHDTSLTKLEVQIENHQLKLGTKALVKETGTNTVKADGIVTIVDIVNYECLNPNKDYILKGKIYDLSNNSLVVEAQTKFNKNEINGSVEVLFDNFDLRNYPNKSLGILEELYVLVDDNGTIKEEIVKSHNTNLQDADQMIHIQKLHTAAMVLYKIGSNNQNIKLSGAYFNVKTSRTRLDGVVEEYDLGTFLTGGIFHSEKQDFNFIVAKDEQMTQIVKTYSSYKHNYFPNPIVSILGLEDGIYYGKVEGSSKVNKYYVAKGMIFLPEQIEDTLVTYQELVAPVGYDLDKTAFSFSVGHDYAVDRVTNYRSNHLTFIPPKTGIE